MNFKETLQNDINNVFLNLDEFAEEHDLNGYRVAAVIDDDFLDEITVKIDGEPQRTAAGLFGGTIAVYVKKDDFGKLKPGRELTIDKKKTYIVMSTSEQDGMLKIVAKRTGG